MFFGVRIDAERVLELLRVVDLLVLDLVDNIQNVCVLLIA